MSQKIDYAKLERWKQEDALCDTVGELIDLLSSWDRNLPLSLLWIAVLMYMAIKNTIGCVTRQSLTKPV